MASKKFTRYIDKLNYSSCLYIVQHYGWWKEGHKEKLLGLSFIKALFKRLLYLAVLAFRFNKNPYRGLFSKKPKLFFRRLIGLNYFEHPELRGLEDFKTELKFVINSDPEISIIIPVFNQVKYTEACLRSVLKNTQHISYEVIVIDDCSDTETQVFLNEIKNIVVVRNPENLGFLKSCMRGATVAKGHYLCFLNNDTIVTPLWLKYLRNTFEKNLDIGLVGSKLIFPSGLNQEVGGLVNAMGIPRNYGIYDDPKAFAYTFLRDTDYCSGASILVKASDFNILGGFDERFSPAYYEDTDLAFSTRLRLGKRVVVQPLSEVIHFEGVSSGKKVEKGTVKYNQLVNAKKFTEKWSAEFSKLSDVEDFDQHIYKYDRDKKAVIFIDYLIPTPDQDSGSRRLFEIISILVNSGMLVYFYPTDPVMHMKKYSPLLVEMGVRVIAETTPTQPREKLLAEAMQSVDFVWICKMELNDVFKSYLNRSSDIGTKGKRPTWIFDTVDLGSIRLERGVQFGEKVSQTEIDDLRSKETELSRDADITLAITRPESDILMKNGAREVKIVPNVHTRYPGYIPPYESRQDLCFIGGFNHLPNIDAVNWIIDEIMPLVWKDFPFVRLFVLGSNPPESLKQKATDQLVVTGYLEDVSTYFLNSRVFVAPLRYGAGMKGKLGHAMEYGLPMVTTEIGAEGMDLTHNYDTLIANSPEDFAAAIKSLYTDAIRWNEISRNALNSVERFSASSIKKTLMTIVQSKN